MPSMSGKITSINISLPRKLRTQMERKINREAYSSASEYVRALIRKDLHAQAIEQVDQLLLEGLNSGPPEPIDENFWLKLKDIANKSARRRA